MNRNETFFDIPEAALVRPLGEVAENKSAPMPVPHAGLPGLGIPVGGFGAGSFMVNQCGTFGPWNRSARSGLGHRGR